MPPASAATGPARRRVLAVGDLNPDLILGGDVVPRFGQVEQLLDRAEVLLGGSAAITAHGLARLGRPVSLLACVGADVFGDHLRGLLAAAGVDVGPVVTRADAPTGLSVILSRGDDRGILTLPGAVATLTGAEVVAAVAAARADGLCHIHVGALFLQPALAMELPAVLASVRRDGVTVSLDTNHDPRGTWAGVDALLPHLDLLLPNRAEAAALAGADDALDAARRLAARGPLVVVKDGAAGAFAVGADGAVTTADAPRRPVVDSTGAGDTFNAAFIDGWLDGRGLDAALLRAATAGALSVGSVGGTAGQPTQDDLVAATARVLEGPGGTHGR